MDYYQLDEPIDQFVNNTLGQHTSKSRDFTSYDVYQWEL